MKEKDTNKLVQQSLLKTSEGFTDELMHKIEQQKATPPVRVNWWPAIAACLVVGLLGMLISQLSWENIGLTGSVKRLFQAGLALFLIFSFYGFVILKKRMELLEK